MSQENVDIIRSAFADYARAEAEEFIDAGDSIVVTVRFSGRGRLSGISVRARTHQVYTLRDGKIARMDEFTDRTAALKAAGLSE